MKNVLKNQRIARRRVEELRSARLGIPAIGNMRLSFGLFVPVSTVISRFGAGAVTTVAGTADHAN